MKKKRYFDPLHSLLDNCKLFITVASRLKNLDEDVHETYFLCHRHNFIGREIALRPILRNGNGNI